MPALETKPTLETIPQELRDAIVEQVILDEKTPYKDLQHSKSERATDIEAVPSVHICHVEYEKKIATANASSLMLVSRALRFQTEAAIKRLYPKGLTYKLEVAVVGHTLYWPTWIHIPAVSKELAKVEFDFRFFSTKEDPLKCPGGYRHICAICFPEQNALVVLHLIKRFLQLGPVMVDSGRTEAYSVQHVEVCYSQMKPFDPERHGLFGIPENLMLRISHWFEAFLGNRNGPFHLQYSNLYALLRSINFKEKDRSIRKIDMDWMLSQISATILQDSEFWCWKYSTIQTRKKSGLPVVDPIAGKDPNDPELKWIRANRYKEGWTWMQCFSLPLGFKKLMSGCL